MHVSKSLNRKFSRSPPCCFIGVNMSSQAHPLGIHDPARTSWRTVLLFWIIDECNASTTETPFIKNKNSHWWWSTITSTILSSPSVAPTTKIIMESVVDAVVVVTAGGSSNSTDFFDDGVVGGVGMEEDVVEESDEDLFSQYYVALVIDYTIMMSFTWLGMYICVCVCVCVCKCLFCFVLCLSILFVSPKSANVCVCT